MVGLFRRRGGSQGGGRRGRRRGREGRENAHADQSSIWQLFLETQDPEENKQPSLFPSRELAF